MGSSDPFPGSHALLLAALLPGAWFVAEPSLGDSVWLDVSDTAWFVAALVVPVVQQVAVALLWRGLWALAGRASDELARSVRLHAISASCRRRCSVGSFEADFVGTGLWLLAGLSRIAPVCAAGIRNHENLVLGGRDGRGPGPITHADGAHGGRIQLKSVALYVLEACLMQLRLELCSDPYTGFGGRAFRSGLHSDGHPAARYQELVQFAQASVRGSGQNPIVLTARTASKGPPRSGSVSTRATCRCSRCSDSAVALRRAAWATITSDPSMPATNP